MCFHLSPTIQLEVTSKYFLNKHDAIDEIVVMELMYGLTSGPSLSFLRLRRAGEPFEIFFSCSFAFQSRPGSHCSSAVLTFHLCSAHESLSRRRRAIIQGREIVFSSCRLAFHLILVPTHSRAPVVSFHTHFPAVSSSTSCL